MFDIVKLVCKLVEGSSHNYNKESFYVARRDYIIEKGVEEVVIKRSLDMLRLES